MTRHLSRAAAVLGACLLASCDAPPPPATTAPGPRMEAAPPAQTAPGNLRQRQADFLNRLRAADPQQRTIDRAMLNAQNELGLVLDRSVEMEKVPALMKTVLGQMAREFPGETLTVLAYTPSEPPRKVGTARLDARTREMTYTAER